MAGKGGHNGWKKWLAAGLSVFLGLWLLIIIALQIVLNSGFLTRNVNRLASEYVDADISFGKVSASMFKSFPNLNVEIEDLRISYPHERYAAFDSAGIYGKLLDAGRGSGGDTLAVFNTLHLSIDYIRAITGKFVIRNAAVDGARIFAHAYDSTTANWNIFGFSSDGEEDSDTESTPMPDICIKHLALTGHPRIVFTSQPDTVYASLRMAKTAFDGSLELRNLKDSKINFYIDSLTVAGRLPADSLLFSMREFSIKEQKGAYIVESDADIRIADKMLGRLSLPVSLSAGVRLPEKDGNRYSIENLALRIATMDFRGNAFAEPGIDSTYVRAELSLASCPVQKTIETFCRSIMPEAMRLKTDAAVSLTALCDGYYIPKSGALPELIGEIMIPRSSVAYEGIDYKGELALDMEAATDRNGVLSVALDNMDIYLAGIGLSAKGSVEDPLSRDPLYDVELLAEISLDDASAFLPEGMEMHGTVNAFASGMILQSDMSLFNFSRADIEGYIETDGISFSVPADTLDAQIGKTVITLGTAGTDARLGADILGFKGEIDSFMARLGAGMTAYGEGLALTAQNSADTFSEDFGKEYHPVVGGIGARELTLKGPDSLRLRVRNTSNEFKLSSTVKEGQTLPIIALGSRNSRISVRSGPTRIGLDNAVFNASAVKKPVQGDTAALVSDPLEAKMNAVKDDFSDRRELPDFGEAVRGYLTGWDLYGGMTIHRGTLATPYFPLRNTASGIGGTFRNNSLSLDSLTLRAGSSQLSASGRITGITDAFAHGGILDATLDIHSKQLDANEIIAALDAGGRLGDGLIQDESLSEEEYLDAIAIDTIAVPDSLSPLIVLPKNIRARLTLQGDRIDYSSLLIDWFYSDIALRDRTLQITNTVATSNMGDIYFEGFYSTQSKDELNAGFDINLANITANEVIELFPAVDSIVPMLKSFKGNLDCEVAATTKIDTNMNIIFPSINGVMKIAGRDLCITEDEGLKKIGKILMFKDVNNLRISDMTVQGIISDNELEVFPFVMGVDRYKLALSGLQNFNNEFNYHVSILGSPLPFKFGVNLWGSFDNWKWRVCKAKYRDAGVPVFTQELKNMQYNLLGAIHNVFDRGVEKALEASKESLGSVAASKEAAGYDALAVTGELGDGEMASLDSLRYAMDHPDTLAAAPVPAEETIPEIVNVKPKKESCFQKFMDRILDRLEKCAEKRAMKKVEKERKKADGKSISRGK